MFRGLLILSVPHTIGTQEKESRTPMPGVRFSAVRVSVSPSDPRVKKQKGFSLDGRKR